MYGIGPRPLILVLDFLNTFFALLKKKVDEDPLNADCSLVCDAMTIKSSTIHNKMTESFEGFVNFGKYIGVDDENEIASDGVVFMLVSFRKSWKYPIGYILTSKQSTLLAISSVTIFCVTQLNHLYGYNGWHKPQHIVYGTVWMQVNTF